MDPSSGLLHLPNNRADPCLLGVWAWDPQDHHHLCVHLPALQHLRPSPCWEAEAALPPEPQATGAVGGGGGRSTSPSSEQCISPTSLSPSPPVRTTDSFNVAVPTTHDNGSIHHSRTVQKYQSHAIAAPGQYSGSAQSPSLRARKQSTPSPTIPALPPPHWKGRPRSNLAGYLRGVHASPFLRTKCSSSFPANFSA